MSVCASRQPYAPVPPDIGHDHPDWMSFFVAPVEDALVVGAEELLLVIGTESVDADFLIVVDLFGGHWRAFELKVFAKRELYGKGRRLAHLAGRCGTRFFYLLFLGDDVLEPAPANVGAGMTIDCLEVLVFCVVETTDWCAP